MAKPVRKQSKYRLMSMRRTKTPRARGKYVPWDSGSKVRSFNMAKLARELQNAAFDDAAANMAQDDDALWFQSNPGRNYRVRASYPFEVPELDETDIAHTILCVQIVSGFRTRIPLDGPATDLGEEIIRDFARQEPFDHSHMTIDQYRESLAAQILKRSRSRQQNRDSHRKPSQEVSASGIKVDAYE